MVRSTSTSCHLGLLTTIYHILQLSLLRTGKIEANMNGWTTNPYLPEGWLCHKTQDNNIRLVNLVWNRFSMKHISDFCCRLSDQYFQTLHIWGGATEVVQDSSRIHDARRFVQPGSVSSFHFASKSSVQEDINRLYLYPDGRENSVAKQNLAQISAELKLKQSVKTEPGGVPRRGGATSHNPHLALIGSEEEQAR